MCPGQVRGCRGGRPCVSPNATTPSVHQMRSASLWRCFRWTWSDFCLTTESMRPQLEHSEAVDSTGGHWRNYQLLDQKIASQFLSNVYLFSDSILRLGGKCQEHREAARNSWENDRIRDFVQSPEYQPYYDIPGTPVELVWKIHVGKTTIKISRTLKKYGGKTNRRSSISRQDDLHVHVQRLWVLEKEQPKRELEQRSTSRPGCTRFQTRTLVIFWTSAKIMMQELAERRDSVFKCSFHLS